MSSFFIKAYVETVKGSALIPEQKEDFEVMLETYMIEGALYSFSYALKHRLDWAVVPLRLLTSVINKNVHQQLLVD